MDYYNQIKETLINNEINKNVKEYSINKSDLVSYYNVGKLLSEAGKHYGEGIVKEYSKRLTLEVSKGYSVSNLKRMRQFYFLVQKGVALPHQLSWSHIITILPLKNVNKTEYYINIAIKDNLSYRKLRERIKSKEYERLPDSTKDKLIRKEDVSVEEYIKDPIVIKNSNNYEEISEKVLQKMIIENISEFLDELGSGYTYVRNEYKIKLGNNYNYIDLLLFNVEFNSYVVVELKVTSLRKEHIGQIEVYMNYIDKNIKKSFHNKTIGLIIVKKNNKFVIEYSSDSRIISREYVLK